MKWGADQNIRKLHPAIEAYYHYNVRTQKLKKDSVITIEMSDEPVPIEKRKKLKADLDVKYW